MLIKTKHLIIYLLISLSWLATVSCVAIKSEPKTPPLLLDRKLVNPPSSLYPYYDPSYVNDNDQYYKPPVYHDDNFDDNRDKVYR
jgi:hypothetical protein